MKRLTPPVWMTDLVSRIADDFGLPTPEVIFKQYPAVKHVYGFPKTGPDAGKRIKYRKEFGPGYYSAHAYSPQAACPDGRIIVRVREPQLQILPMIVLHEMAHLVADSSGRNCNHSVEFYWHAYNLADKYGKQFGFDASGMVRWEAGYKVRNAVDGYRAYCETRQAADDFTAAA